MQLDRRNFLRMAPLGVGALVMLSLTEKTSAQVVAPEQPVAPVCPEKKLTNSIVRNHGHAFSVLLSDLKKNGAKTYDIQGTSGHPHTVMVTNEVLLALLINDVVEIESSSDAGHTHIVRLEIV